MKALQLTAWKHEPEVREVPDPDPGPGEVVIRVGGAGACHSDLHLMHDFEEGMVPYDLPFTLGHENAGWIEALGPGVAGLEVGLPVAVYGPWGCGRCRPCARGWENYCDHAAEIGPAGGGLGRDGGMASRMLVRDPRFLVPIGDLDPTVAAPITDAGLTAYHAVARSVPKLVAGSTALVIGAGGLGHMGVQILRELTPAQVVVVDQRQAALDLVAGLGAHHGVLAGDDAASQVRALTGGRGVEVVIDFVGADATMMLGARLVRPMGDLTIVGIAGGTLPVSFFGVPYEASVQTTYWGTRSELIEVLALAEAGRITAHVTRFDLDDAVAAYRALAAGEIEGRAVVVP